MRDVRGMKSSALINRRRLLSGLASVVFAAAVPGRSAWAVDETFIQGARRFIENLAADAVAVLTDGTLTAEQQETRFRLLFSDNFDVPTIGQWVLGRHWRNAMPEQRREYLELFEELTVVTYLDRFSGYAGERLTVTNALMAGGRDAAIQSLITRPDGRPPFRVGWRVRADGGSYRIVDVIVENVSLGLTQRSEFATLLHNLGGSLDRFLTVLRDRVDGIRRRQA